MCHSTASCRVRISRGRRGAARAGAHLGEWLEHLAWPDPARIDVLLAVHEATSLALDSPRPDPSLNGTAAAVTDRPIEVSSVVQPGPRWRRLRIWIRDPARWPMPTPRNLHDPLHGIGFLRTLADQILIRRSADGSTAMLLTPVVHPPGPSVAHDERGCDCPTSRRCLTDDQWRQASPMALSAPALARAQRAARAPGDAHTHIDASGVGHAQPAAAPEKDRYAHPHRNPRRRGPNAGLFSRSKPGADSQRPASTLDDEAARKPSSVGAQRHQTTRTSPT